MRENAPATIEWPEGALNPSGNQYLVIDGWLSQSNPASTPQPWLTRIGPLIEGIDLAGKARGFSYGLPRKHYGPQSTDIPLLSVAGQKFLPYAPSRQSDQRVTYLSFSLGGPLLLLGLQSYLNNLPLELARNLETFVPAIILIQPALVLSDVYLDAAEQIDEIGVSSAIGEYLAREDEIRERLLQAVQDILDAGIPVYLLYWKNDHFLYFPSELIDHLKSIGVITRPIELGVVPDIDDFRLHCLVSDHPSTKKALATIIKSLAMRTTVGSSNDPNNENSIAATDHKSSSISCGVIS